MSGYLFSTGLLSSDEPCGLGGTLRRTSRDAVAGAGSSITSVTSSAPSTSSTAASPASSVASVLARANGIRPKTRLRKNQKEKAGLETPRVRSGSHSQKSTKRTTSVPNTDVNTGAPSGAPRVPRLVKLGQATNGGTLPGRLSPRTPRKGAKTSRVRSSSQAGAGVTAQTPRAHSTSFSKGAKGREKDVTSRKTAPRRTEDAMRSASPTLPFTTDNLISKSSEKEPLRRSLSASPVSGARAIDYALLPNPAHSDSSTFSNSGTYVVAERTEKKKPKRELSSSMKEEEKPAKRMKGASPPPPWQRLFATETLSSAQLHGSKGKGTPGPGAYAGAVPSDEVSVPVKRRKKVSHPSVAEGGNGHEDSATQAAVAGFVVPDAASLDLSVSTALSDADIRTETTLDDEDGDKRKGKSGVSFKRKRAVNNAIINAGFGNTHTTEETVPVTMLAVGVKGHVPSSIEGLNFHDAGDAAQGSPRRRRNIGKLGGDGSTGSNSNSVGHSSSSSAPASTDAKEASPRGATTTTAVPATASTKPSRHPERAPAFSPLASSPPPVLVIKDASERQNDPQQPTYAMLADVKTPTGVDALEGSTVDAASPHNKPTPLPKSVSFKREDGSGATEEAGPTKAVASYLVPTVSSSGKFADLEKKRQRIQAEKAEKAGKKPTRVAVSPAPPKRRVAFAREGKEDDKTEETFEEEDESSEVVRSPEVSQERVEGGSPPRHATHSPDGEVAPETPHRLPHPSPVPCIDTSPNERKFNVHQRTMSIDSGSTAQWTELDQIKSYGTTALDSSVTQFKEVSRVAAAKCIDCGQALPSEMPFCPATGKEHPLIPSSDSRCVTLIHPSSDMKPPVPSELSYRSGDRAARADHTRYPAASPSPSLPRANGHVPVGAPPRKPGSVVGVSSFSIHNRRSSLASASMYSADETDLPTAIDRGSVADTDETMSVKMFSYNLALKSTKMGGQGMTTRELLQSRGCFTDDEVSCD